MISRRGLLLAGGGLVVGAGGAELGNAMSADAAPSTATRPPSPGEDLMTEHGVLKRLLLAYQAAADQLAAGRTPPVGAISDAAAVIADFVEGFHEGLEEAYVFPRMQATHGPLVATLLTQHDRGRHLTAAISALCAGDLTAANRALLGRYLTQYVRMYAPHEAWEDTVLFPALREQTPQKEYDQLGERFADLEDRTYRGDAITQMLGRVEGVEQQLGIGDLAAFTPPLVYPPS